MGRRQLGQAPGTCGDAGGCGCSSTVRHGQRAVHVLRKPNVQRRADLRVGHLRQAAWTHAPDADAGRGSGGAPVDAAGAGGASGGAGAMTATGGSSGDGGWCTDDGLKICGNLCTPPSPQFGCGTTGCAPRTLTPPPHGYATCANGQCSFDCLLGYKKNGDQCEGQGVGGTGGSCPTSPAGCPDRGPVFGPGCCAQDKCGCSPVPWTIGIMGCV
jgi:hypothetical protein